MSNLQIHIGFLKQINRADIIPEFYRTDKPDTTLVNVSDIETRLSKKEIELLKDIACKAYNKSRNTTNPAEKWPSISNTYTGLLKISKLVHDDQGLLVSDLGTLENALKTFVARSSHRWMFLRMKDGSLLPYYVSHIKLQSGYRETPHVDMTLVYEKGDGNRGAKVFSFYKSDFMKDYVIDTDTDDDDEGSKKKPAKRRGTQGIPVSILCNFKNLYLGTDELYNEYLEELKKFDEIKGSTGIVMIAKPRSLACYTSTYSRSTFDRWAPTGKEDSPSMLITDENDDEKVTESSYYSWLSESTKEELMSNSTFWGKDFTATYPIHPRIKCFDMSQSLHCMMHIGNLDKKVFNPKLGEKLVIPEKDRTYIDMLMVASTVKTEDIIAGKSGGTAIVASGPPGTGKTLTAEIYSEKVGMPLYSVQCSELGIDPENLEKNLKKILRRAERWNAILQLDEADVYIRRRGDDLVQNAVVGCFLRLLEYFSGILFMSTNKADDEIDDAILSRCVAHLRYKRFEGDLLKQGWTVLSAQFGVDLSAKDISQLMEWKPELSGRSIKTLLKNTKKFAAVSNKKATFDMVKMVSEYSPAMDN